MKASERYRRFQERDARERWVPWFRNVSSCSDYLAMGVFLAVFFSLSFLISPVELDNVTIWWVVGGTAFVFFLHWLVKDL